MVGPNTVHFIGAYAHRVASVWWLLVNVIVPRPLPCLPPPRRTILPSFSGLRCHHGWKHGHCQLNLQLCDIGNYPVRYGLQSWICTVT